MWCFFISNTFLAYHLFNPCLPLHNFVCSLSSLFMIQPPMSSQTWFETFSMAQLSCQVDSLNSLSGGIATWPRDRRTKMSSQPCFKLFLRREVIMHFFIGSVDFCFGNNFVVRLAEGYQQARMPQIKFLISCFEGFVCSKDGIPFVTGISLII